MASQMEKVEVKVGVREDNVENKFKTIRVGKGNSRSLEDVI